MHTVMVETQSVFNQEAGIYIEHTHVGTHTLFMCVSLCNLMLHVS